MHAFPKLYACATFCFIKGHAALINFRIDDTWVIKVADFGLSKNTGSKDYFRQDEASGAKLPVKWMAPESLREGVFSEKTDIVSNHDRLSS